MRTIKRLLNCLIDKGRKFAAVRDALRSSDGMRKRADMLPIMRHKFPKLQIRSLVHHQCNIRAAAIPIYQAFLELLAV